MFTIERRVLGIKTFEHWFEYNETQNSLFTLNPQLYIAGEVPKKYFQITALGKKAMEYTKSTRDELWSAIPSVAWDTKIVVG